MGNISRILVVEDEEDINELISYNLGKDGFAVVSVFNGDDALKKVREERFDLVVLDLMLPGIQGMELCRIIRNEEGLRHLPIVMLTAKGEEVDRILGLELGADDYMAKPFSPRELSARIRAVLRRSAKSHDEETVTCFGDLVINHEIYSVTKGGRVIDLSPTEFKLLIYLIEKKGRILSREHLLNAVWKDDAFVEPRTVDVHIRRLRTQIEDHHAQPVYIKTTRGVGYYVEAEPTARDR